MKRPDRNEYLKLGINAATLIDQYEQYCDYFESQNKELREENDKVTKLINAFYFLWRNLDDKRLDDIMNLISELKTQ